MHCVACDVLLTDEETRKKDQHGQYPDMCSNCLETIEDDVLLQDGDVEVFDELFDDIPEEAQQC